MEIIITAIVETIMVKLGKPNNTVNNIASGSLPKTGEGNLILIGCIGLVIACSTICYIKMRDLKV